MARRPAKKKHRGVKDPYKQIEERYAKIKDKINCKPANDETQEISRKLKSIVDFNKKLNSTPDTEKSPSVKKKKRRKKKGKKDELIDTACVVYKERDHPGMKRPLKMIPRLKQFSNETDKEFYQRFYRATQAVVAESKFEDKYKVDIDRNESGEVDEMKRRKLVDDPLISDKLRAKLQEREKTKKEKKKERDYRRKHKNKKEEEDDEFTYFQDKVEFGEVVYEPPSLDTSRFSKMNNGTTKTKSFLFMEKIKGTQVAKIPELTVSRKRTLEEERVKAVQAYRDMKAAKYKEYNKNMSFG